MVQKSIPAVFMRGGTSKALMFHVRDLPAERDAWTPLFLAAIGAPDPNGRQLDGMGGGVSSLSKVCVIGPPTRADADVDYTFAQIGVREPVVDYGGNCGNMSSAIGPFAVDEGLVPVAANGPAVVRIHNTNTGKIIRAHFQVVRGKAAVSGGLVIDGVAGSGAPIRLEFMEPGGSKTGELLPTGRPVDRLVLAPGQAIDASLVDAANPCVFVSAEEVGLAGNELPDALEARPEVLARLEEIRLRASVAMGLAPDLAAAGRLKSIPKVAAVTSPRASATLSGTDLTPSDVDIVARMISVGQPHRAIPLTGALCLAVACRTPGTLPNRLARASTAGSTEVRIGQPSGRTIVDAHVIADGAAKGGHRAEHAAVYRTARRLFEGSVLVPG